MEFKAIQFFATMVGMVAASSVLHVVYIGRGRLPCVLMTRRSMIVKLVVGNMAERHSRSNNLRFTLCSTQFKHHNKWMDGWMDGRTVLQDARWWVKPSQFGCIYWRTNNTNNIGDSLRWRWQDLETYRRARRMQRMHNDDVAGLSWWWWVRRAACCVYWSSSSHGNDDTQHDRR